MRHVLKRIAQIVTVIVLLAVAFVITAVHTSWGRDFARRQAETILAGTFVGGATIGKIEGSPFGTLVARDVVINGPDGKPAFKVGTLHAKVQLVPLLHHHAVIDEIIADDVQAIIARDVTGHLEIVDLLVEGPPSEWKVDLDRVELRHVNATYDNGGELIHLDDGAITGTLAHPPGGPLDAHATVTGQWRERGAKLALTATTHVDDNGVDLPFAVISLGDATVNATSWHLGDGYRGSMAITAPAKTVAQLLPGVELPGDATVSVRVAPDEHTFRIAASALVGKAPVQALLAADTKEMRVSGVVATTGLDVGAATNGAITGTGDAVAIVGIESGSTGALPIAHAIIQAHGEFAGYPMASVVARVSSTGNRAKAIADVSGPAVTAHVEGEVETKGKALALVSGRVRGTARDIKTSSAGKLAATGALDIDLTASGAILPKPDLAVRGRVDGRNLGIADARATRLHALIDGRSLPGDPHGTAHVQLDGLVRGDTQLGQLTVDAANRSDGSISVQVRSKPTFAPVVVEADAIVRPEATVAIELVRHHVRAMGRDWTGKGGRITISSDEIAVRDLRSQSGRQQLAVDGMLRRRSGDFDAKADLSNFGLDTFDHGWRGNIGAHVAIARKRGVYAADVKAQLAGAVLDPVLMVKAKSPVTTNAVVELHLHDRDVKLAATADGMGLGSIAVKLDATAPARITDARAWTRLGRDAIREASVEIHQLNLERVAKLAGAPPTTGVVDAKLTVTPSDITGRIMFDKVSSDAVPLPGAISTDLAIGQTSRDSRTEIAPRGTIKLATGGAVSVDARLEVPDRLLDVAAWQALGRDVLRSAKLQTTGLTLDQGLLSRVGIEKEIHGSLDVTAEIERGGRQVQATIDMHRLHGSVLAKPIDVHVDATSNAEGTSAKLTIKRKTSTVLTGSAKLGVSVDAIRASTPLTATFEIPPTAATDLTSIIGRTDITHGKVEGKIAIAGSVGKPTVDAKLEIHDIALQPSTFTKGIQGLQLLTIAATWDGTLAKVKVDGKETEGGTLHAEASANPHELRNGTLMIEANKLDLQPLAVFAPDPGSALRGRVDGKLSIKGLDPATSKVAGKLKITDARVPLAPSIGTLRKANVEIGVDEHKLDIKLDGRLGGGTVSAQGSMALAKGDVSGAEVKMKLRNVAPIGGVEPHIDADVTTKLSRGGDRWKLEVVVDHGSVKVPADRREALSEVGAPADMRFVADPADAKQKGKQPTHTTLEVDITLHDTNLESDELRGILRGKLQINVGDGVGILGDIEADRGDLDLFGQRYTVDHAAVHFDGSTDPLLDVSVVHDFPDVTTRTQVQGRLSSPKLIMTSEPAIYSQGQLLGFLLGGEPNGDPQAGSARQTATDAGASLVGSRLSTYMRKALPVSLDVLRYESATASTSAAVLVGTWLTRSLFLAYRQHLDALPDENTGEGTVEYWLSRRLVLEGTVGDRNVDGLDLLWRRRW